jgi:hypothetical protein
MSHYHALLIIQPFPIQFFCQPHTPQVLFDLVSKEAGGLLVIILQFSKRKTWRNRKSTTCAIRWLMSVLHEEKHWTGSDSGLTNATKTVSDVFRHRGRTGKSYCLTRSDIGSERVIYYKGYKFIYNMDMDFFSLIRCLPEWLNSTSVWSMEYEYMRMRKNKVLVSKTPQNTAKFVKRELIKFKWTYMWKSAG